MSGDVVIAANVLAAVLTGAVAWRILRQRDVAGATSFGVAMAAISTWALLSAAEGTLPNHAPVVRSLLYRLEWIPTGVVAVAWLSFALAYTGREGYVTRRRVAAASLVPGVTVLVAMCHPYLVPEYAALLSPLDAVLELDAVVGFLTAVGETWDVVTLIGTGYLYLLLTVGSLFVLEVVFERPFPRPGQALVLLLLAPPWVLNVLHMTDVLRFQAFDPTILGFVVTGIAGLFAVGRFELFEVPLARARVVEEMDTGVLVYGSDGEVYDRNDRARSLLSLSGEVIGRDVRAVLADSALDVDPAPDTPLFGNVGDAEGRDRSAPSSELPESTDDRGTSGDDRDRGPGTAVDGGIRSLSSRLEGRTLRADDDPPRYVEPRVSSLTDTADRPMSKVLHLYEVTERERSRRELERSRDRYRAIFENNQVVFWEFDLSGAIDDARRLAEDTDDLAAYLREHPDDLGRLMDAAEVTDVNEQALTVYSADSKRELLDNLDQVFLEESLDTWTDLWATVVDGETQFREECKAGTLDGEEKIVLSELMVPEAHAEDYSRVYLTALDITDRKERERELERYHRLVENLEVGAFRTTPEGEFVAVNEKYAEMMADGDREAILAADPREVYVDDNDRGQILQKLEGDGSFSDWEVEVESLYGDRFWVSTTMTLVERDGQRYIEGVSQDVTERKERKRELKRKNEFLDEFARVVSHDVATPLNVIENKARLVEMTGDPEHAEDIYEATQRVQRLVDELRDLAQQGKQVGETAPVDLESVAEEAWGSVEADGATLTVESTRTVEASRSRFRQLLENLLGNAVEHGSTSPPSGTREDAVERGFTSSQSGTDDPDRASSAAHEGRSGSDSRVGTSDIAAGGTRRPSPDPDPVPDEEVRVRVGATPWGFYVEDDGPGIPESDREAVFEQGFSTDEDGTGLGLAIVARIAEGHGWSVDVTAGEDGGARFEIHTGD